MGYVELHDGIANRRIPVPELCGSVRIDLSDSTEPAITVPETVLVETDRD